MKTLTLRLHKIALGGLGSLFLLGASHASALCTYTVDNDWGDGFLATITVKNDTGSTLNGWDLSWTFGNNRLVGGWNAEFTGTQQVSAKNLSWNGTLTPGQSVSFGFQGSKSGAAEIPTIRGSACAGGGVASSAAPSSRPASSSSSIAVSSVATSSAPAAQSLTLQEAAPGFCRVDGTIDNNHAGFTGTGFANSDNFSGAGIQWAVNASRSERYTLRFRFANGGTQARPAALIINGGTNGNYSISLPVTNDWGDWRTQDVEVDLVQGNNTITLNATGNDGLANIDSITLVGAAASAGNCPSISSSSSSSSGASSSAPQTCALTPPFRWTSTQPVLSPKNPNWASIKDPTIVKYNGDYHVYATTFYNGGWKSLYTRFNDWNNAQAATQVPMDGTRVGNTIAPQVFFFRPHNKWYLITQWGGAYATTTDVSNPQSWSAKQKLLQGEPTGALDFWVICNDTHCYLFFSRDDGKLYLSKTTIGNFPNFSGYSVVMEDHRGDGKSFLFEAANVYKLDGQNRYLLLIEAYRTPGYGPRYFRSWTSTSLDGPWAPLADTEENPFAGNNNVTWPGGKWANGISHGELIRSGHDERLTVDPCNLEFLYQGETGPGATYDTVPYRLGLLRLNR